nr:GNAT family N-acetyltransferase [Amphritea balenae]
MLWLRLCFSNSLNQTRIQQITKQVISTLQEFAQQHNASGWHTLFIENHQFINAENQTLIKRLGCQYHWFNRDYHSFEDFLAGFSSRKRKNLKKERTKILNQNIEHRFVKGPELSDELLESFYRFYQITYLKRGRQGYLKKNFFHLLRDLLPEQLLICFAFDTGFSKDEPVAGALFMQGEDTLYGRYWGALEEYDSLHFETCYYQGIEYCIANQISRFDPGAQGEHKIQRGFEPIETWSTHWLARPEFRSAVQRFTEEEEQMVRQDINFLKQRLPFKKPS